MIDNANYNFMALIFFLM